jgi:hypothetical protein
MCWIGAVHHRPDFLDIHAESPKVDNFYKFSTIFAQSTVPA